MGARVDDAVVLSYQFFAAVAADVAKRLVDSNDAALAIRHRHDGLELDGAQQHLGVAHGDLELALDLLERRDVGTYLHET